MVAHLPALGNGFTTDDRSLLVDNPFLRSARGLPTLLSSEMFIASGEPTLTPYYRPLSSLLYWLSYQGLGARAPLQHGLNVVMHMAVAWLLVVTVERLGASRAAAAASGLLFAVHPVGSELVAYLGGRQDMLGWLFALAALLVVSRGALGLRAGLLVFLATFAAISSREFFLFFPPVLATAALLRGARAGSARRAAVALLGSGAAVAAATGLRRALGLIPLVPPPASPSSWLRAAATVELRLLRDALAPTDLSHASTLPLVPGSAALAVLTLTALAAAAGFAWLRRSAPERLAAYAVGVAVFGVAFIAHAAVLLRFGYISDRYAYVTLLGLTLAGAAAASPIAREASRGLSARFARRMRLAPLVLAVATLPLTWSRDLAWKDDETLISTMIADRPDDPESEFARASLALEHAGLDAAHPHCLRYAEARPESDKAAFCLGAWLLAHGRAREAVPLLERYVRGRPGFAPSRRALLAALLASGQLDAVDRWLALLEPDFPGASELVEARAELARRRAAPPAAPDRHPDPR
ncbi:MAG: hypothetical protein OZ921_08430 [Sorangiineae bacterium]|nr:hypothetical protein [Sorangiineae bacterium]